MVKIDLEALRTQSDSAKSASKQARNALKNYQKASSQFQDADQLKGQGYQAAKNYCSGPMTTLLTGLDAFYEEAGMVLGKLADQYESKVDSKSWDSEELQLLIQEVDQIIQHQKQIMENTKHHNKEKPTIGISSQHMVITLFEGMKHHFEEILQNLEEFSSQSASWFSDLQNIESSLSSAILSLSEGLNVSDGIISVPNNQDWEIQLLNFDNKLEDFKLNNKIENLPKKDQQKDQQIIRDLEKTYNLDTQSAYSLYKLQQGILSKAKKEGWNNKKIIFEYNRLLASCSYIVTPLKGKDSKNLDDFKLTNSNTYVATRWQALCQTEDWKTTKKLLQQYGLSLSEINHLRKEISVQHELASTGYKTENRNSLDLSHEAVQIACFTEQPSKTLQRFVLHKVSHYIINLGLEHAEISYKGDIDSGRLDSSDVFSDIDAINMYQRMTKTSSKNVFDVSANYHRDINSGKINRVDEFYKNNSLGTNNKTIGKRNVKLKIGASTPGSIWIKGTETPNGKAHIDNQKNHKENINTFWKIVDKEQKRKK